MIWASAGVRHTARFRAFYGTRKDREGTLFLLLCLLVLFGALCATRVFFCAKNHRKAHLWHKRHELPEEAQKARVSSSRHQKAQILTRLDRPNVIVNTPTCSPKILPAPQDLSAWTRVL